MKSSYTLKAKRSFLIVTFPPLIWSKVSGLLNAEAKGSAWGHHSKCAWDGPRIIS